MKTVIVISGPTASGKSSLAMELAQKLSGVIVSADSMQIYRGMDIGTAKPAKEDMRRVEHRLIDVLDIGEPFSVADYKREACAAIDEIISAGRQPFLVGGTGLYIDAVMNNVSFGDFECPPGIREELSSEAEKLGAEHMYGMLKEVDPEAAEGIHPNNMKRVIRALEVYRATGKTITYYKSISKTDPPKYNFLHYTLVPKSREELYARINARVDKMMEDGLEREARELFDSGLERAVTACQAIGYKELFGAFRGDMTVDEAVELLKQRTRNYAKRQLTWFSRYDAVRLYV